MDGQEKRTRSRVWCLALNGVSAATLGLACGSPALAQCAPDPTVANGTSTCTGTDPDGIAVTTPGTTITVAAGAVVTATARPAITINVPVVNGATNREAVNVAGQVQGGSNAGLSVFSGPVNGAYYYGPGMALTLTIAPGGSITGGNAVSLLQSGGSTAGGVTATIVNNGTLNGTSGVALLAGNPSLDGFTSITNGVGGFIGTISGPVGTLTNAGMINGGANSAVDPGTGYNSYTQSGTWTNTGTITSAAATATLRNLSSPLVNNGTISDTGVGTAIQGAGVVVTNQTGGRITAAGGAAITATAQLTLTNAGTVNGDVVANTQSGSYYGGSQIDSAAGTINGDVILGTTNDVLIARYNGTSTLVTGIAGSIDGGGGTNSVLLNTTQNTMVNTAITLPTNFQRLRLAPASGTTMTLANGFVAPGTIELSGSGSVLNSGTVVVAGQAFVSNFNASGAGLASFTNTGTIRTTGGASGTPALDLFSSVNAFTNSGTINVVGDGLNMGQYGAKLTNTGSITATGTAVTGFDVAFNNSGTIRSTGGIGVALSGDVGGNAINSGLIQGTTVGVSNSINLTNTGTIIATQSNGVAVALQPYGVLINSTGGVVGNGGSAVTASVFTSAVYNAGTINGVVSLSSFSPGSGYVQGYVSLPGGVLNGNLSLGANELLLTDLAGTGAGGFAGINGTVTAAGGTLLRLRVSGNASATLGPVGPFAIAGYELNNGATLALTATAPVTQQLRLAGAGTVTLNANIATSAVPAIFSTSDTYVPGTTTPATKLNITSAGALSIARSSNSYPGAAVYLGSSDSFTNTGTISVSDRFANSSTAAIFGGASVTNAGAIRLDGGVGVTGSLNYGFNTNTTLVNTGTITQIAGGATSQGVTSVGSVVNSGTISVGGTAVQSYGGTLTNSGVIRSTGGVAIADSGATSLNNLVGGTIAGVGIAVQANGGVLNNAGMISGNIDLGYGYSGSRSYTSALYVASGGTVAGNLTFGAGNDVFLQTGAASGVSGVIDGGAGRNVYGFSLAQSGAAAIDRVNAVNFQDRLVQAAGAATVATITAAAPFAGTVYVTGDGTVDNTAVLTGLVQAALPSAASGVVAPVGAALATLVNDGTMSGGLTGSVTSTTNNGQIGSATLTTRAVSLSNPGPLSFSNTGQIVSGIASGNRTVRLQGNDTVTAANSGTITGGLFAYEQSFAGDPAGSATVTNTGTLLSGNAASALLVEADTTGTGASGTATVINSGVIAGLGSNAAAGLNVVLFGADGTLTTNIVNSGTISVSNNSGGGPGTLPAAVSLSSSGAASGTFVNTGSITTTGTAFNAITASGLTLSLDNSGTIASQNGVAVQLGTGNDLVTLRTGSSVTGAIVGGGGTDAAVLVGTGTAPTVTQTAAAFTGFDNLTVQSGYWTAPAEAASTVSRTIINAGAALELANGAAGIAGYASPSYLDNGTLVVRSGTASGGSTLGASVVSGAGNVLFTGPGTALLDGVNSLQNSGITTVDTGSALLITGTQGGSFVSNGTLQIGAGGVTGSFTGDLADNGTALVYRSGDTTLGGALTGTGIFVQQGAGRVIFIGAYAFAGTTVLNGGTIRLAATVDPTTRLDIEGTGQLDLSGTRQTIAQLAGASGAATVNIDGGALTVNQAADTAFAGALVGSGSLTKTGAGSLNLTGASSYTGPTSINGGRLAVNGRIASAVTVNAGGALGGNGVVGSTTIASGGTLAPVNSIGAIGVAGGLGFAAGSIYQVEANAAGAADRVDASGAATLAGGTVQVLAAAGSYQPLTTYTILTAQGGVSGRFAGATSNLAFLTPFLAYAPTAVTLELGRNDISFAAEASAPNGVAVANAIAARGLGDPIYNAILVQSAAGAANAFAELSGEIHTTVPIEIIDSDRRVRDAVLDHARTAQGTGVGLWLQSLASFVQSRDQPSAFGFNASRYGVYGGVDYAFGGFRVGVSGGHIESKLRIPGLASRAEITSELIGASIGYAAPDSRLTAAAGGTHGWHRADTTRLVDTAGLAGSYLASSRIQTTQAFGELGYALLRGPLTLTPFVRYDRDWERADALSEIGGAAALTLAAERHHADFGTAGARFVGDYPFGGSVTLEPHASAGYLRGWSGLAASRFATFGGAGPAFTVTGDRLGRDSVDANAGVDLLVDQHVRLGLSGYLTRSNEWSDHGGALTASVRF